MKVLLTGASSFTGYWFAKALAERGATVIAPLRSARVELYTGVRQARTKDLASFAVVEPGIEFGSSEFLALFDKSGCDLLCHHAARVADYRSPDFDISLALQENTRGFKALSERVQAADARRSSSPAVFSKQTKRGDRTAASVLALWPVEDADRSGVPLLVRIGNIPLGKFVIPNPFGPFEEPRFCAYLAKTWAAGETPEVRTPLYVRDNIHVSLLAKAYADFALTTAKERRTGRFAPTQYVESQGAFAQRFASEVGGRSSVSCPVKIGEQTDFSEPLVRINTDPVDFKRLGWSEASAWDEVAAYYAEQLKPL